MGGVLTDRRFDVDDNGTFTWKVDPNANTHQVSLVRVGGVVPSAGTGTITMRLRGAAEDEFEPVPDNVIDVTATELQIKRWFATNLDEVRVVVAALAGGTLRLLGVSSCDS